MRMLGPEQFSDPTVILFGKLLLAMILGGIIGTERAVVARQAAGTRTFGLVALGACLFVVIGTHVDSAFIGIVTFDPLRIAASVVMGIGFLAGGLIIFKRDAIHGATTAAGLWIATGIGMAVGFGMYAVSVFAAVLTLLMFSLMWYVENRFKHWFEGAGYTRDDKIHSNSHEH